MKDNGCAIAALPLTGLTLTQPSHFFSTSLGSCAGGIVKPTKNHRA
jgi:hypothetical protein